VLQAEPLAPADLDDGTNGSAMCRQSCPGRSGSGIYLERAALVYANETPFLIFLLLLVTVLFAAGLHEHRTPTR
jgi:hypothetical protein